MDFNHERKKRHYAEHDEIIDIPFLLNTERALSACELRRLLPKASYAQYFDTFFRRRILDIFKIYSGSQWFKDRYLSERTIQSRIDVDRFILIREMYNGESLEGSIEKIKEVSKNLNVFYSQQNIDRKFTRDFYVIPKNKDEIQTILERLSSFVNAKIVETSALVLCEEPKIPDSSIQALSQELSKYEVPSTDDNHSALSLRRRFNFCVICGRKFDNNLAMLLNCSKHTESTPCLRNIDILGHSKNLGSVDTGLPGIFENYYCKNSNGETQCKVCEKIFESKEYIIDHLKCAHENLVKSEIESGENLKLFLERIDFFAFELALGTHCASAPQYAQVSTEGVRVVYDMPTLFSGEIKFD